MSTSNKFVVATDAGFFTPGRPMHESLKTAKKFSDPDAALRAAKGFLHLHPRALPESVAEVTGWMPAAAEQEGLRNA